MTDYIDFDALNQGDQPIDLLDAETIDHQSLTPAIRRLFRFIDELGEQGVSDVHVHPKKPVRRLFPTGLKMAVNSDEFHIFSQAEIREWLAYGSRGRDSTTRDKGHASVAISNGNWRVRGTFRYGISGLSCTLRLIPSEIPDVDRMEVPEEIRSLAGYSSGLVLVEGPTGSGKTTLIASLIDLINRTTDQHIYCIEDPIEFVHFEEGHTAFTQREIGVHARDFPTAVEDALRSKPNVILIGELLNPATAKAALEAATTGHLVFTTAHAGSVTEAIQRFVGQHPADEQSQIRSRLADSLLGVVVQKLIKDRSNRLTPVREVLISNDRVKAVLDSASDARMIRQQIDSNEVVGWTLEDDLYKLVMNGRISPEEAMKHCKDIDGMKNLLQPILSQRQATEERKRGWGRR
ncbi:type IV pilus twitching motility protein PilT [Nesterenkonia rhizosphaerae]|uniref:Type IV pilus twitching motility protein PilT n=1 Tax=Nesterenkonia rhizosphaerae TaxID=1348272 RepID=A0ABP9G8X5_9MICC